LIAIISTYYFPFLARFLSPIEKAIKEATIINMPEKYDDRHPEMDIVYR